MEICLIFAEVSKVLLEFPYGKINQMMSMRESILKALISGEDVSGGRLSKSLGMSRTAVWKHIRWLRRMGYPIRSSPRRGYRLLYPEDVLLPSDIRDKVPGPWQVVFLWETDSTQEVARELAVRGSGEPTAIVAEIQRRGRGRMGRTWASPIGGIYMSVILKPTISPSEALKLPLLAGVSVAEAIRRTCGVNPSVKWPNDVLLDGKKVAGILCEMDSEVDRIHWVILGVGINVNSPIPEELLTTATSIKEVCGRTMPRSHLLLELMDDLWSRYQDAQKNGFEPVLSRWRELSSTLGQWVVVSDGKETQEGLALDIDEEGALLLEGINGRIRRIISGDVSLRHSLSESS
jgi:BirA family biotin operon repressor/biotin-[acetyl-CoA-carboxylase] ligase